MIGIWVFILFPFNKWFQIISNFDVIWNLLIDDNLSWLNTLILADITRIPILNYLIIVLWNIKL